MLNALEDLEPQIQQAAQLVAGADAILIGAGAGMGVDSGLPDFRGNEGFWRAYPHFRHLGLSFTDLANPRWFADDPAQAWGFYGHRYQLYCDTQPHGGFSILRRWLDRAPKGGFVFTSNVDGQFQRAGFAEEQLLECHGSIHFLQCSQPCSGHIWPAQLELDVDNERLRLRSELPRCERCGAVARPNILMFGDGHWLEERCAGQHQRYRDWLRTLNDASLVVIELGAGTAVPTVRYECERLGAPLIRINPREAEGADVEIAAPAYLALQALEARLVDFT